MKKVVAITGSPRKSGNSTLMLERFVEGCSAANAEVNILVPHDMNLKPCTGCLRCNILGRCSQSGDDWAEAAQVIADSDVLVVAAPIYFHHLPAPVKMLIDRFRSFVKVRITPEGLIHTPFREWKKDFVLLLSMGSSDNSDARPVIELFEFMADILGTDCNVHAIQGTRLALSRQIEKDTDQLAEIYSKLGIPVDLAGGDARRNTQLLGECYNLGKQLTS